MKAGGGKGKGSGFEREVCKELSKWVSGGKRDDIFWRSAISGGRATVAHKAGKKNQQGGDICCVDGSGHVFTDKFSAECKFVKDLKIPYAMFFGGGELARFWEQAKRDASRQRKRALLFAKQNGYPPFVLATIETLVDLTDEANIIFRIKLGTNKLSPTVGIVLLEDLVSGKCPYS